LRAKAAILVNLLVPGAGLIILQREWLGVSMALLFVVLAQLGISGLWIVPEDVPRWQAVLSMAGAGLVWLAAQLLALTRYRTSVSPVVQREIDELRARAEAAMQAGDLAEARQTLQLALNLNDEDLPTLALYAQVLGRLGEARDARRSWRRVRALDRHGEFRAAADAGLAGS
jgi:tetratricopeptide (TPR) repeat protein